MLKGKPSGDGAPHEAMNEAELHSETTVPPELLLRAEAALKDGNDLLANDILYRALRKGLKHPDLGYLRVLALANVGSTEMALRQFEALAPPLAERESRWMTLHGRLEKDLGWRSETGARRHFQMAAQSYLAAFERYGSAYAAVNAASLFMLCHNFAQGQRLAVLALAACRREQPQDETARYYHYASRAEASLVLGDMPAVGAALRRANTYLPLDRRRRSRSLQQMRRVCAALDVSAACLDALHLPLLILLRRVGPVFEQDYDGAALSTPPLPHDADLYAGLCDAFDLSLIERLQATGHRLRIALPYRPELVLEGVQQRFGAELASRLQGCLDQAVEVFSGRGFLASELHWAARHVTERVLGLSLLAATRFGGSFRIIEVHPEPGQARFVRHAPLLDSRERAQLAVQQVQSAEVPVAPPSGRRMVGLIFADFAGFQRIEDADLPRFWNGLMRALAGQLDRHGDRVLLRRTWGDALHIVTRDAATAAEIMADIQLYLELHQLRGQGVLSSLGLRIAGHYAPAFEGHDPVEGGRTYYGTQLSLTARIEPVTPPGLAYVTEALGAQVSIEAPGRYALEYAGEIELAKRFGAYRLYSLRRLRI